ncbi:transposase [Clostridia bacterium]|nr:transposase [Clostridia bacterium]
MTMMNEETRRKLRELNLGEMITALDLQNGDITYATLSFDERLKMAIDHIYQEKYNDKVQRLIKLSKFRIMNAVVEDIHYVDRGLDRQAILEVGTCQFIDSYSNVVFHGFTGAGKSFLACAIGKQACKHGKRTRYIRLQDLLAMRDEATLTSKGVSKLIKQFSSYVLLILDEWLIDELSEEEQRFLYEIFERRHDTASTIFCTQYKKEDWHIRLGGEAHADAIMDRIVHNTIWIYSGNLNMREFYAKKKQ